MSIDWSYSPPGTPARQAPTPILKPIPVVAPTAMNTTAAPATSTPKRLVPAVPQVRTPTETKPESSRANRSTLVIKKIDTATTEADVRTLFELFAIQTGSKIVCITVRANRGNAFVDYDAAAPVLKAVEQHTKEPMQIRGRVLEIYQKTSRPPPRQKSLQ
jgi:RNA recognition motif-containing protein